VIIEVLEHELIDVRLSRAADQFIRNELAGISAAPSLDLRFAAGEQIPEEFRALKPGLHEIDSGGRILEALIIDQGGQRYAVIDDLTDFERLEFMGFAALCVAFFAGVLLALAIARVSASRIIAPLTALAHAVQQDDLAARPELLAAADEIGVLARAFHDSSEKLRRFLDRERLFTADVSHEMRTPLTVILGAAETLTARLEPSDALHAAAERIRRVSAETSTRVSALLQLARSRETAGCAALALRALVAREIDRCRPLLEGKPVSLAFEAPAEVWVHANPDLVAIAVGNLISNAFQFTDRGSVRVVLSVDALVVEDTGPGIADSLRERLFDPFVRGTDVAAPGSGLGLSIVKRVTEYLDWTIRLDKSALGGSRFTLAFAPGSRS
jgi:signal transduction histidine kinase